MSLTRLGLAAAAAALLGGCAAPGPLADPPGQRSEGPGAASVFSQRTFKLVKTSDPGLELALEGLLGASYDAAVMDLSFISLKSVLPAVWPFLRPGGTLIALVKPQFEAGKAEVDRGSGVIRDDAVRARVLAEVRDFALRELPAAAVAGEMECPVHGADGNREYLLGLTKAD